MSKKIVKKLLFRVWAIFSGMIWYLVSLWRYWKSNSRLANPQRLHLFPKLFDRDPRSHTFDKHYVYMDRWAFAHLLADRPKQHVDVGSSVRFLSMASTVTDLQFVDIRPLKLDFNNFHSVAGSILNLPFESDSIDSLSCLHVTEHIGLGRYGDELNPEGTRLACSELERVLAQGGTLYFALPIGKERTVFNAHRILSYDSVLSYFPRLSLEQFCAVGDDGRYYENANRQDFVNSLYACGMFKFRKR